uniref:Uncharacterized protein n=1 Tax=Arundo donax TaxID=35708 RepID=A0A0A9DW60_ARUDO
MNTNRRYKYRESKLQSNQNKRVIQETQTGRSIPFVICEQGYY